MESNTKIMKKVISFCLFGDNPKYCQGAIRNAELAQQIYPDWVCQFVIGKDVPLDIQGKLANLDNVDLCDYSYKGSWDTMLDRLSPSLDPAVECFISRDCDSRLSAREKDAVDEWLESDKIWHIMRDHPYHTVPILGGMLGVKKQGFGGLMDLVQHWQKNTTSEWQQDQNFLQQVVWPVVQHNTLIHDSIHYNRWGGIPFPKSRSDLEFVGQVFDENDQPNRDFEQVLFKYLKMRGEPVRNIQL